LGFEILSLNFRIARGSGSKQKIFAPGISRRNSSVVCPTLAPTSIIVGSSLPISGFN